MNQRMSNGKRDLIAGTFIIAILCVTFAALGLITLSRLEPKPNRVVSAEEFKPPTLITKKPVDMPSMTPKRSKLPQATTGKATAKKIVKKKSKRVKPTLSPQIIINDETGENDHVTAVEIERESDKEKFDFCDANPGQCVNGQRVVVDPESMVIGGRDE